MHYSIIYDMMYCTVELYYIYIYITVGRSVSAQPCRTWTAFWPLESNIRLCFCQLLTLNNNPGAHVEERLAKLLEDRLDDCQQHELVGRYLQSRSPKEPLGAALQGLKRPPEVVLLAPRGGGGEPR